MTWLGWAKANRTPIPGGVRRKKKGVLSWEETQMHGVLAQGFSKKQDSLQNFHNLLHHLP